MSSFQFSLQGDGGYVSAYDSSDNGQRICVGYSRCLAIYRMTNPMPAHVIHLDSARLDRLRMQHSATSDLIAGLRNGVVTIWESQSALSPIVGMLESSSPGAAITDMDWAHSTPNLLATGCSGGSVRVYDTKMSNLSYAAMSVEGLGSVSEVSWCPCASHPHLLAVVSDKERVLLFDSRRLGSRGGSGSGGGDGDTASAVAIFEPHSGRGVQALHWLSASTSTHSKEEEGAGTGTGTVGAAGGGGGGGHMPAVCVVTTAGKIERWNVHTHSNVMVSTASSSSSSSSASGPSTAASIASATTSATSTVDSSVPAHSHPREQQPIARKVDQKIGAAYGGSLGSCSSLRSSEAGVAVSLPAWYGQGLIVSEAFSSDSSGSSSSDNLAGKGMYRGSGGSRTTKLSVYGVNTSSLGDDEARDGGFLTRLDLPPSDVLGLFWTGGGSSSGGGKMQTSAVGESELFCLSKAGALVGFSVPLAVVSRHCISGSGGGGGGSGGGERGGHLSDSLAAASAPSDKPGSSEAAVAAVATAAATAAASGAGGGKASTSSRIAAATFNGRRLQATPRLATNSLKQAAPLAADGSFSLKRTRLHGSSDAVVSNASGAGGTGSGGPSGAEAGPSLWDRVEAEVMLIQDNVEQELLPGLSVGMIDQYARQVTLLLAAPDLTSTDAAACGSEGHVLSLIARFPARSAPSFALRGLERDQAVTRALVGDLDDLGRTVMRSLNSGAVRSVHTGSEKGLLPSAARLFRERCWPLLVKSSSSGSSAAGGGGDGGAWNTPSPLQSPVDKAAGPAGFGGGPAADGSEHDIIDPLAYRVPCPACSGARWSGLGHLVLFGGSAMQLEPKTLTLLSPSAAAGVPGGSVAGGGGAGNVNTDISGGGARGGGNSNEHAIATDRTVYPRTLGDLLIRQRDKIESEANDRLNRKFATDQSGADGGAVFDSGDSDSDQTSDGDGDSLGEDGGDLTGRFLLKQTSRYVCVWCDV